MKGKCYLCGANTNLERHHVWGGARRPISEKYGAVVNLCHFCHNEPPYGVHHNAINRMCLQEQMQRELMAKYGWSIQDFIKIFGKNYI
ncbi:MAG: hypothetical protein IJN27_01830 [Oscillospiraceae bacterium]|nr:hypothetical protein [Oscillospiraceae bacterium]